MRFHSHHLISKEGSSSSSHVTAKAAAAVKKRSPSDFLKAVLGRSVKVRLNSGTEYRGVLACLDGYLNIAMEQTEEYVNGQLKAKYGDCFIRGNNGMLYRWRLLKAICDVIMMMYYTLTHCFPITLNNYLVVLYISTVARRK